MMKSVKIWANPSLESISPDASWEESHIAEFLKIFYKIPKEFREKIKRRIYEIDTPSWILSQEREVAERRKKNGHGDQVEYCTRCGRTISSLESRVVTRRPGILDKHYCHDCWDSIPVANSE